MTRPKNRSRAADWRSPEERAADRKLDGTWFRCRVHGLQPFESVLVLGHNAYCGPDTSGCSEALLLAHNAERNPVEWNGPGPVGSKSLRDRDSVDAALATRFGSFNADGGEA